MKLRHVAILMVMEAVLLCAGVAIASRNSSGTMSAINGPFTSGSVINSSAINTRYSDIETEITNSLDRSGRGAMTGQLQLASGTVTTPGLGFSSSTGSGLYRIAASDIGFAINGSLISEWTSTGLTHTLADNDASIKLLSGSATKYAGMSLGRTVASFKVGVAGAVNNFATGTAAGDAAIVTTGAKLWFDTNAGSGTPSLAIAAANGGVIIGGGAAITKSVRGSGALTPAAVAANLCATAGSLTATGATTSSECIVLPPSLNTSFTYYCRGQADLCDIVACNVTTGNATPTSGTYSCRVFVP